jgi:hypothetical protein
MLFLHKFRISFRNKSIISFSFSSPSRFLTNQSFKFPKKDSLPRAAWLRNDALKLLKGSEKADAAKPHLPSLFIYPLYNRHPERSEGARSFSMIMEQI